MTDPRVLSSKLSKYGIKEEEIESWINIGVSYDNINETIKYLESTRQHGKNFSEENANAIRQELALLSRKDQYAFIPIINEEKPDFLKYTKGLREGFEKNTYRTETDMSVMIAAMKKNLIDKIETKKTNFQYTDKDGEQKDDIHTYDVLKTEEGNFVLLQPVGNDNFEFKLLLEINDFKNSKKYGQNGEEVLTFLVPETKGEHWILSACTVSFPEGKVKDLKKFDSLNDGRQTDGWSCGVHTMEAAYSLITGKQLETASGKNIETLYNNIDEAKKEKSTDYTCMSNKENEMLQKTLATSYVENLKQEYVRSDKNFEPAKVDEILNELSIEKDINSYSKDLLEDKDLMKDVIANIVEASKDKTNFKEVIKNAKEMLKKSDTGRSK